MPSGPAQVPSHWTSTSPYPINPPASPPTRIDVKAMARAVRDGSAERASGRGSGLTTATNLDVDAPSARSDEPCGVVVPR